MLRFGIVPLLASVVLFDGIPASGAADKKKEALARASAERLVLVYALEDLNRDWHGLLDELHRAVNARKEEERTQSSARLKAEAARLRRRADSLRRYITAEKLNPELLGCCEVFLKQLDRIDKSKGLAEQLEKVERKHNQKILALWKKFFDAEEFRRIEAASSSLEVTTDAFIGSSRRLFSNPLDDLLSGAFAGFAHHMALEMRDLPRRKAAFARAEKEADALREAGRKELLEDLNKVRKDFLAEFGEGEALGALKKAAATLAKEYGWEGAAVIDVTRWADRKDRPSDPFILLHEAEQWGKKPPASGEDGKRCLALAKECYDAAQSMIPTSGNAYYAYRARLYAAAGALANLACAEATGTGGFLVAQSKPPAGASLAVSAWRRYQEQTSKDSHLRAAFLHQKAIALAYSGKVQEAVDSLSKALANERFPSAEFWFDAARMVSIRANKLGKARKAEADRLAGVGLVCLRNAMLLGYNDVDGAKLHTDLTFLRTANLVRFEDTLRTQATARVLTTAAPGDDTPDLFTPSSIWTGKMITSVGARFESELKITHRDGSSFKGTLRMLTGPRRDVPITVAVTGTVNGEAVVLKTGAHLEGKTAFAVTMEGSMKEKALTLKGKGTGLGGNVMTAEFTAKFKEP